ncbi:unnamed protein product [Absidia cylindrospora]
MRLYTQQQSLVPLFMQPYRYINSCKPVPHLRHLIKLLSQLPPITIAPEWTPRITRYAPLTQALQHANPADLDTENPGQCLLCHQFIEDPAHLILQCAHKTNFWRVALKITNVEIKLEEVWDTITFQNKASIDQLILLGDIILVIWQHHWMCVINNIPWNTADTLHRLCWLRWNKGIQFE